MKTNPLLVFCLLLAACSTDSEPNEEAGQPEAPRTTLADENFEAALVDAGLDNAVDGSVQTSRIAFLTDLNLDDKGITSLEGIEDFQALVNLSLRNNALTTLDLSRNGELLFVWAENNAIRSLELGNKTGIEKVGLSGNRLQGFDAGSLPSLQLLTLAANEITALDVSGCPDLNTLAIEGNPVDCIQVSAPQLERIPVTWTKDATDTYSESCGGS